MSLNRLCYRNILCFFLVPNRKMSVCELRTYIYIHINIYYDQFKIEIRSHPVDLWKSDFSFASCLSKNLQVLVVAWRQSIAYIPFIW